MITNQVRIWIGLGLLSLLLLVAGYWIGERQGLLFGFLFAILLLGLSYHFSESHWVDFFGGKELEGQDPWGITQTVATLSTRAKMRAPKIYMLPISFPTAFSIGRSSSTSRILISQGCLDTFAPREIEAILAHEISRIYRGDPLRFGVIAGLSSPLLILVDGLDSLIWIVTFGRTKRLLRKLFLPVFELFFRILFHKADQFETDRYAAHILRDPELLARVLMKLQSYSMKQKADFPPTAAESMIVNPLTVHSSNRYFKSQPSVEDRISQLIGRFPV